MSEPTEREWLEGIGERFEMEHEQSRVTPDREQLAEALAEVDYDEFQVGSLPPILAAARAWLDQGDALVIRPFKLRSVLWPLIMDAYHFEDDDADDIADAEEIFFTILDALSDRSDNG